VFFKPQTDTRPSWEIGRRLLILGGFMVAIGLMVSVVGLLIRAMLIRRLGEEGVGMFQSASGLSTLFASYILGAMGTDFLPRLSSASHDHPLMNRMINDQTHVALLLGLPGVVVTIVFAPLIVPLFYSSAFEAAVPVVQLLSIGVFGRLLVFPLGFALIAKNAVAASLSNEVFCHIINLSVTYFLLPIWGVRAAGFGSVAVYICCPLLLYPMTRSYTGLIWSREVLKVLAVGALAMVIALMIQWFTPAPQKWIGSAVLVALTSWYSVSKLASGAEVTSAAIVRKIRGWFRA
jgi:enterobacterial common antigen flippase